MTTAGMDAPLVRELRVVASERPIGAVVRRPDGSVQFRGAASSVLGRVRRELGDVAAARAVLDEGWSNGYLYLAPPDDAAAVTAARRRRRGGDADDLERYWTKGEGLGLWATNPHPWTTLRDLLKRIPEIAAKPGFAERLASTYFRRVFHHWPGHRKGRNPHGPG